MDKFDLLEKVVNTTGVSYEDAKNALENCDWDILEAVIYLEKEGKIEKKGADFNTEAPAEKTRVRGSAAGNNVDIRYYLRTTCAYIFHSKLVLVNRDGNDNISVPLFLAVALILAAFWPTLVVLILFFIMGYKVQLQGPYDCNDKISDTLNKAGEAVSSFFNKSSNTVKNAAPSDPIADPVETCCPENEDSEE